MSRLRHLSRGKISAAVRSSLSRARSQPKDAWILIAGILAIGIIGTLTTYPGAIVVSIVVALVLIFSPPEK